MRAVRMPVAPTSSRMCSVCISRTLRGYKRCPPPCLLFSNNRSPGRLDRKIEIPLPNDAARMDILKIHAGPVSKKGEFGTSDMARRRQSCRQVALVYSASSARHCLLCLYHTPARYPADADWEAVVKLTEGFNGADMRNVCTEVSL